MPPYVGLIIVPCHVPEPIVATDVRLDEVTLDDKVEPVRRAALEEIVTEPPKLIGVPFTVIELLDNAELGIDDAVMFAPARLVNPDPSPMCVALNVAGVRPA